ncbi:uncharacterized protein LOC125531063 isoform X2 [Triticum urartu]|uniref:uncharacterized protein LOC125531063 isoform X2 n=1 Tax=Triticum urartu TaxID=4572 RepID=UPI002042DB88|nr:uncharacterized protein LOC125531063 isoform X2 [Triticum urartu]XP_048551446.1 uncharacterized protein LOC125531063 isoform X2 [Triticum urartu]
MNWASCCLFFLWVLFVRVDGVLLWHRHNSGRVPTLQYIYSSFPHLAMVIRIMPGLVKTMLQNGLKWWLTTTVISMYLIGNGCRVKRVAIRFYEQNCGMLCSRSAAVSKYLYGLQFCILLKELQLSTVLGENYQGSTSSWRHSHPCLPHGRGPSRG